MGCRWLATLLLVVVTTPAIMMDALVVVVVAGRLFDGADGQARGARNVFRKSENQKTVFLSPLLFLLIFQLSLLFFFFLVWLGFGWTRKGMMGFNRGSERWLGSVEGQGLGR